MLEGADKLIERCLVGDREAQKKLYDHFASKMLSVCYRYTRSHVDAQDVFQEGFMKVFQNLDRLKEIDSLEGWIRKIFINEALQIYHRNRRDESVNGISGIDFQSHEEAAVYSNLGIDEITKAIQQLPDKMRLVFNLYVLEGYSHQEISDQLQISIGTSKSNLHDARLRLQTKLTLLEKRLLIG